MNFGYENVVSKIKWADKHITDFRSAAERFNKGKPYEFNVEKDSKTGQKTYVVTKVTPIPPEISLIIGDALHSFRSALDCLACCLVNANQGHITTSTCFPITDAVPSSPSQQASFDRKIAGMRQDAKDAIRAIRPYKGGDETLWRLHRLNITDKHRMLMAAASAVSGANPGFTRQALASFVLKGGSLPNALVPIANSFPLKPGYKFTFWDPKSQVNEQPYFLFEIAFNEPGVAEGEIVWRVLSKSSRRVKEVARELKPFLY